MYDDDPPEIGNGPTQLTPLQVLGLLMFADLVLILLSWFW